MASALDGIRVLDASTGVAGPMAAMFYADFGADVVKVEPPGGDPARSRPGFALWNRNKRGIVLDPTAAADHARLWDLLHGADLCVFGGPLDDLRARGLDPESVRALNPALVYLHMPPFTQSAPWAGQVESNALVAATTGMGRGQGSLRDVPVDLIYPHVLYGQAIWAASCGVAALVERQRSGHGQTVTVGALHGMMMTMSGQLTFEPGAQRIHRPGGPPGGTPFYRPYECADGLWLFLATLIPKFYTKAFQILGVDEILTDPRLGGIGAAMALPDNSPWVIDRIQRAFRLRPRQEWLDDLRAGGIPCGPLLRRDDWLDSDQIRAIGMRVEVEDPERGHVVMPGLPLHLTAAPAQVRTPAPRLGQHSDDPLHWSPREAAGGVAPVQEGPLSGYRVLDLGAIVAGPFCGSLLAELGADVIKVEITEGDGLRTLGLTFVGYNKGKRSLAIDLASDAGHEVILRLVRDTDALVNNYRPGVLEHLGIDYDSLRQVNPALVMISVTGFGEGGPMEFDPGFDPLAQAISGMMHAQGGDGPPAFISMPVNDVASAGMASLGIGLGLLHRERTGQGQRAWTSLASQSVIMQCEELMQVPGRPPAVLGAVDFQGPSALDRYYATADGWLRLQATGPGGVEALRAAGFLPRDTPATDDAAVQQALSAAFAACARDDAVGRLTAAGVPAARALTHQDVALDPLFEDTEIVHLHAPEVGLPIWMAGRYARFSRTQRTQPNIPPGVGEHSLEILAEAGYDADGAAALLAQGVVVQGEPFALIPPGG